MIKPRTVFLRPAFLRPAFFQIAFALTLVCACQPAPIEDRQVQLNEAISGYHFQDRETQLLQDDDFANPGMLWVDQGRDIWQTPPTENTSACNTCHIPTDSMQGVAATYPQYDVDLETLINLEGRINHCRQSHQGQPAWQYESQELLSITAFVANQSKGLPMQVDISGAAQPYFEAGQRYFFERRGQMDLACAHCHEDHVDQMLRGDRLSQGQPTGYPLYRLEWQGLGSLHRRLRFCNTGVRAEPFVYGAQEYVDLELYLAWRAQGLKLETPGVRR